jgi:RHS repeat-associated protein
LLCESFAGGSPVRFAAYDGNGNVSAYVDAGTGAVAAQFEYGAFGEVLRGSVMPYRFGFSTKYNDWETDLLYYGYRYYNASTGRWISRDPSGERGGLNSHDFVSNDGINKWDKLGLKCCLLTWYPTKDQWGHSALQCDGNLYISAWPVGNGTLLSPPSTVLWHAPRDDLDSDIGEGRPPDSNVCSDCLDTKKAQDWFKALKKTHPQWSVTGDNCANYTLLAIEAGLGDQKKPDCGKCSLVERLGGALYNYPRDVIGTSDLSTTTGTSIGIMDSITSPSEAERRYKELIANGCNKWKCETKYYVHP